MSVYRITNFTSSDMGKLTEFAETLRGEVADAGAESIDVVAVGDGKGLVIAKYATDAAMAAAADVNKSVFGKMIGAGLVDGDSISGETGEVAFSF